MAAGTLVEQIRQKYGLLAPSMDERVRRQWGAIEAQSLGWRGVTVVVQATGMSHNTLARGLRELVARAHGEPESLAKGRIRQPGGGRKQIMELYPSILETLESLVEPGTRGDAAPPRGLQPSIQSQGSRRSVSSRPQRPNRTHRRTGEGVPTPGPARDFRGHDRVGSAWASTTTRPALLRKRFGAGGKRWGGNVSPMRARCSSPPMAEEATDRGAVYGKRRCRIWRTRWV